MSKRTYLSLSVAAVLGVFMGFVNSPFAFGGRAGESVTPLDPSDPDPLVSIKNKTGVNADDIHFELAGGSGHLKMDGVHMVNAFGTDMGWNSPRKVGKDKYTMDMPGNGTPILPGKGAGLQLQSENTKGWSLIKWSLTHGGKTIYPSIASIEGFEGDVYTTVFQTGNGYPVELGAMTTFENEGPGSVSELRLSVGTAQTFENLESDFNGYPVYEEHAATWVFEPPVDPGNLVKISWDYDRFGPDVNTDVEARFLMTDLVFGVDSSKEALAERKARRNVLHPSKGVVKVPDLYVRETRIGGLKKELVLSSSGKFKFVRGSGTATLVKGSLRAGLCMVSKDGNTLKVALSGHSKELCVVKISGVEIDLSKTKAGVVRIYLESRGAKVGKVLGVLRP